MKTDNLIQNRMREQMCESERSDNLNILKDISVNDKLINKKEEKNMEMKLVECREGSYFKDLDSSSVVKTLTDDCSLKCVSLDQIGQLSSNANAKKGTSVLCEINLSALSSKECKAFFNSMNSGSKEISSSNFSFVILDLEQIKSEYFDNSSISSIGANNFNLYSFSNLFEKEFDLKNENTMLVSTTNFIYDSPLCLLDIADLNSLPSSMQSLSVNLESLKSSSNFSNISSCFILLENASLAIEDQFNHPNLSILAFNSSGIDKVMLGILTSGMYFMFNMYKDISHVFKGFVLEVLNFLNKKEQENEKI